MQFFIFLFLVLITTSSIYSSPTWDELIKEAQDDSAFVYEMRRYLHMHPQIYLQEYEAQEYIMKMLSQMNITHTGNWGKNPDDPTSLGTGVVAEIGTGKPPCVGLRADIDALYLTELVDSPFKSTHEGYSHACGHDAHTAMLLAAAKYLKSRESEMEGTVRLLFTPGEEGGAGAYFMNLEGVVEMYPPIQRLFAEHILSIAPTGKFVAAPEQFLSGAQDFWITFTGKGGAVAHHNLAVDPVAAGVAFVRSLYDFYSRELYFQIESAGLVSVTLFESSSNATNIIPETVNVGGTLRGMTNETLNYMIDRVYEMSDHIAKAYKCTASVSHRMMKAYPPMYNDPTLYKFFTKLAEEASFPAMQHIGPLMGGEDFTFLCQKTPCVMTFIGTGSGAEIPGHPRTDIPHHSSMFFLDERVLPIGAAFYTYFALESLNELNEIANNEMQSMENNSAKWTEL